MGGEARAYNSEGKVTDAEWSAEKVQEKDESKGFHWL